MYVQLTVTNGQPRVVEMEGAKTIKYAAKLVAETLGADVDADWRLLDAGNLEPIPEDDIAADWDGREVVLGLNV